MRGPDNPRVNPCSLRVFVRGTFNQPSATRITPTSSIRPSPEDLELGILRLWS